MPGLLASVPDRFEGDSAAVPQALGEQVDPEELERAIEAGREDTAEQVFGTDA